MGGLIAEVNLADGPIGYDELSDGQVTWDPIAKCLVARENGIYRALPARFGERAECAESLTSDTSTGTSWTTVLSFTPSNTLEPGKYLVSGVVFLGLNSTANTFGMRVGLGGTYGPEANPMGSSLDGQTETILVEGVIDVATAGTPLVEVQCIKSAAGDTLTVYECQLTVERVPEKQHAVADFLNGSTLGPFVEVQSSGAQVSNGELQYRLQDTWMFVEWADDEFNADQFAEAVIAGPTNLQYMVNVRRRTTDDARYGFAWDGDPSSANYQEWVIKYDGVPTNETRIVGSLVDTTGPEAGDSIRLEVEGLGSTVTLRGYHNGSLLIDTTDTDVDRIVSGDQFGIGVVSRQYVGETVDPGTPAFSSFRGGDLQT